ncbi:class I SAM-dependent methyltransferase [Afifella pfennigii]|uniref:class I SAM-dependent methyltransferase n=1 Tax=Afifella pfennigii TaxID=209897 RepID=UPI000690494A|nr:class I SAM-dependent methyltransferase [Afifella pfennigii]
MTIEPPALAASLRPRILATAGPDDYALIDSGNGRKLERFGDKLLDRPEEQAMWAPSLPASAWQKADAVFTGDVEEEGAGRWKQRAEAPDWTCRHGALRFSCRLTSFRHVGVFPEQEAQWRFIAESLGERPGGKLLNLFGYTGIASLVAAAAGAEVAHVDASKKAIAWARENQALSGLEEKPIRWLTEDAGKFAAREVRRGNAYDMILLDPPKYGRGPKGETWRLFEDLPQMLKLCAECLKPGGTLVLTAYAIRASYLSLHQLCADILGGKVTSGEMALIAGEGDANGTKALPTSLYCRAQKRP